VIRSSRTDLRPQPTKGSAPPRRTPAPAPLRLLAVCLAFAVVSGCARIDASRRADDPFEGIEAEVASFNAEELFACGSAAFQAEDFHRAAVCFSRLADRFPDSPRAADAGFNAGAAYERLGAYQLALDRFRPLLRTPPPAHDLEVTWRVATCLYHLGEYDEAIALLEPIAERRDVAAVDRIRARTHAGVCKVEKGEYGAAEADLRKALALYRSSAAEERIESYFPSQAQFFLGEIYRIHFSEAPLDAVDDTDAMRDQLEHKAQLLLSAQGHYLRTLRLRNPHWSTAAGQRVGGLYEDLYDQMMEAPVPSGLDAEQADLYRAMLRRKVRVLVQKAISIYERTLSAAERTGVSSAFIDQTRDSLERMKQVLLSDAARDEADGVEDDPDLGPSSGEDGASPDLVRAGAPLTGPSAAP